MDVMREPGLNLSREIAKGEAVEAELDNFITRRDEKRRKSEPEREMEELWKASEGREAAHRRKENRASRPPRPARGPLQAIVGGVRGHGRRSARRGGGMT